MGRTEWMVVTSGDEVRLSIVRARSMQVVAEDHKFSSDDDLFELSMALLRAVEHRKKDRKLRRKGA